MKIYDNNGKTFDRYTIIIEDWYDGKSCDALCLSENCDSPQGFSQVCDVYYGKNIGKEISFDDLPDNVKEHIINRLQINE